MHEIKVGPTGDGTYRYQIAGYLSAASYHNSASAWHDARRPQTLNDAHQLTPDVVAEGLSNRLVHRNWPPFLS